MMKNLQKIPLSSTEADDLQYLMSSLLSTDTISGKTVMQIQSVVFSARLLTDTDKQTDKQTDRQTPGRT